MRWVLWFLLVPQLHLAVGWLRAAGAPPLDVSVAACLFAVLFARPSALPGLLLGAALGRAVVEGGNLAVQVLALAVPVAVLLPLRHLLFGQRWLWQGLAAALLAVAVPRLDRWFGELFRQAGSMPDLDGLRVVWCVLLVPPLVWLLRRLPPLRLLQEVAP